MKEFEASNGWTITVSNSGRVRLYGADRRNRLQACDFLDETDVRALRDFFAQEYDEDLPFRYGDYWVHELGSGDDARLVIVVARNSYKVFVEGYVGGDSPLAAAAAQAYFAAHPKPNPWLDAQSGEVWSISDGVNGGLAICQREPDQDSDDDHPYFYGPNFDGIRGDELTDGTKLEVQS